MCRTRRLAARAVFRRDLSLPDDEYLTFHFKADRAKKPVVQEDCRDGWDE